MLSIDIKQMNKEWNLCAICLHSVVESICLFSEMLLKIFMRNRSEKMNQYQIILSFILRIVIF